MSECIDLRQMTGSTRTGPLQPREVELLSNELIKSAEEVKRYQRVKMTPVPQQLEQPIQLTPVWEHVVRTQQFPPDVDTCSTFTEITSRLCDPEWEVRQHALRVLVDVLPTLDGDCVDELMTPVLVQLINNLGHLAPAVRKGALDALRIYMQCTGVRDNIIQTILNEGLNRQDVDDLFQTNITLGVILSTPSLLFPSNNSPKPSRQSVKFVIAALIACLGQVANQEAAVRSLVKIRNIVGAEEFYSHLSDHDPSVKRDFDVLCQVYNLNQNPKFKKRLKKSIRSKSADDKKMGDNKNCPSGGNELERNDEDTANDNMKIPPSRIVLETEIKFNEETAITMTILEEKDEESDADSVDDPPLKIEKVVDEEHERKNSSEMMDETKDDWIERRKTPRRVHFGGEIVKLRTPDSDDSEVTHAAVPQTRIPLPISPVTKMTISRPTKSRSNPSSPNLPRSKVPKKSRSVSNSPKKEIYVHDGSLSPKKSILMKSNSSFVGKSFNKSFENSMDDLFGIKESDRSWSFEVFDDVDEMALENEIDLLTEKPDKLKKVNRPSKTNSDDGMKKSRLNQQIGIQNDVMKSLEKSNEIHFVESPDVKVGSLNTLAVSSSYHVDACEQSVNENVSIPVNVRGAKNPENTAVTPNEGKIIVENRVEDVKTCSITENVDDNKTKDKMRCSPRKLVFESFPRQERNYILMELSSPVKGNSRSREVSPQGIQSTENSLEFQAPPFVDPQPTELNVPAILNEALKLETSSLTNVNTSKQMIKDKINEDIKIKSKNFIAKNIGTKNLENSDDNGSKTDNSTNGETKIDEPSWEELGLVDQDVLNDLHNKEDWRARVRGLERVASALRTSSALIAIEPRLGSLLQCILGGERSCRVAAAGMAVARVVVAGVSEEALKRRLPQVAWGLSRQGGPNAAQLARIAMLRLRPALFLEQLLQPHCIDARNAKTRENALQLLIFSLVTFPSTEFKVENVANKVALMVGDRRRRVRQAALDTLAVLAQIYEAEEVLQAGRCAAKQLKESADMVAAIRARLARKSLPMVSADGLVVYGLQISPTVQIATGPDVDWIVAGSGSVSPGTGRPRGQIISMDGKTENNKKNFKTKNESRKISTSATERNFVAVGVGLHPKNERPMAWQLVPPPSRDGNHSVSYDVGKIYRTTSPTNIGLSNSVNLRIDDSLPYTSPIEIMDDEYSTSAVNVSLLWNDKDVIMTQRKTEENFHKRMDEIYGDRSREIVKIESRIPIRQFHDHQMIVRHSTAYQRRRHPIDEGNHHMPSSAPHSSISELRDAEIQKRYRSDRIKQPSRPVSNDRNGRASPKPTHDSYVSGYRHNRRKKVSQTITTVDSASTNAEWNKIERGVSSTSGSPFRKQSQETLVIDTRSRRISSIPVTSNGSNTDIEEETREYNEKNRRNVSAQANPRKQITTNQASQCSGHEREKYEFSSDTSNERDNEGGSNLTSDESNITVSSPEKAFDIITQNSNPSRRNSIDQLPVNILSSTTTDSTDIDKETSSDDVMSGREVDSDDHPTLDPPSGSSVISNDSNSIDEVTREVMNSRKSSGIKAIAFDENDGPDISLAFDRHYSNEPMIDTDSAPLNPINSDSKAFLQSGDFREQKEKLKADDEEGVEGDEDENREVKENSKAVSIIVSSRPHSRAAAEYREVAFQPLDIRQSQGTTETTTSTLVIHELSSLTANSVKHENVSITNEIVSVTKLNTNELPVDTEVRVVTVGKINRILSGSSRESMPPEIVGIHSDANEVATPKRFQSRVPRSRIKMRTGPNKIVPVPLALSHNVEKPTGKLKSSTSQCLTQLESNDWEVTVKGLKSLSIIARQEPEQLDTCPPGTIGRLLGRHVRNLRSQVARIACLAAGDAFATGARCIDQDLDDIVGPLLHRTADTNKFLRADSNAALDRMVEHLPPQRTIAVIVYRGVSHQNAVVRATTARLLSSMVDRIGPSLAMTLPRDVRDKLLGSGAKLLMDGNLDARNHAKIMFKRLSRCDGFRKALTECVPEATLRHIDKTLRSL